MANNNCFSNKFLRLKVLFGFFRASSLKEKILDAFQFIRATARRIMTGESKGNKLTISSAPLKTFVRVTSAFVLKDGSVRVVLAMGLLFLHVVLASREDSVCHQNCQKRLRGRVDTRGENSSKTFRLSFRLKAKILRLCLRIQQKSERTCL